MFVPPFCPLAPAPTPLVLSTRPMIYRLKVSMNYVVCMYMITVYKRTRQTMLDSCISNSGTEPDVRKQEESKNYVYLFVFCMNLGEINALLTISCCQMKHFGYVIVYNKR